MDSKRLRSIKVRHLSAFVESARLGSLKAAALRIGVGQSAISKAIRELEDVLGTVLLSRNRSGTALTQEGQVFLQFAEQGLASVSHGVASLEALTRGTGTPVRIGALPSVAAGILPDVVHKFNELSPSSPVLVEDGPITTLIARLREGQLDLVVGRLPRPETMAGLSFTQLYMEQVVFVAAKGHPKAAVSDPRDLRDTLVLYPPEGAAIRTLADRFTLATGVGDWPKKLETVSGAFGRSMTLGASKAIWIISYGVVARDIETGRLVRLPIDTALMDGPVGVMARSEDNPSPGIRLFRQTLIERTAPLVVK